MNRRNFFTEKKPVFGVCKSGYKRREGMINNILSLYFLIIQQKIFVENFEYFFIFASTNKFKTNMKHTLLIFAATVVLMAGCSKTTKTDKDMNI